MKKRTLISAFCAGAITLGAFAGLVGFQNKTQAEESELEYTLVADSELDQAELNTSGSITGVADVAEAVMPAVVSITNKSVKEVQDMFGMYGMYGFGWGNGYPGKTYTYESESCGSGIIIGQNDTELLICTNYHVVQNSTELSVGFIDDEVYPAQVKGYDEVNDLAVVSVELDDISDDTMDVIRIAQIGNSDDLRIGEQVVAIGNALGYGQSVTTGIVSAKDRTIKLDGYTVGLIQTDAAINPGNSGGALLDMSGRVIGINSAKASKSGVEGMGYAIPISFADDILEDLMEHEERTEIVDEKNSAYMGIVGQNVSADMSALYGIPQGIYLTEIQEDSPADEAGLNKGDVITRFAGEPVTSMESLKDLLQYYAAEETVRVTVARQSDGYDLEEVEITLGHAPEQTS